MPDTVRTRILILSDTHAVTPETAGATSPRPLDLSNPRPRDLPRIFGPPLPSDGVDVVIHCGDLTKRSNPVEYEVTFAMLRAHPAPLKIAIPGNHDTVLDENHWKAQWHPSYMPRPGFPAADEPALVREVIAAARQDGVHCLIEEGERTFPLANGALLRVWTSPWTPAYGRWGFQFKKNTKTEDGSGSHEYTIPRGVDVVVTHGPPSGVQDVVKYGGRAGDLDLWRSLVEARPRLHCFGHIHEAWGATGVRWLKDDGGGGVDGVDGHGGHRGRSTSAVAGFGLDTCPAVDRARSGRVMDKDDMRPCEHGNVAENARRLERCKKLVEDRCAKLSLCDGPWAETEGGEGGQTMFINASVLDERYLPTYAPWLVEMDLQRVPERAIIGDA